MLEFGSSFTLTDTTKIEFFIFGNDSLFGRYTRMYSHTQIFDSLDTFLDFKSEPIKIKFDAGNYYMIGVVWDKPLTYKYLPWPSNFTWGTCVATFDIENCISSDSIYYISELDTPKVYAGTNTVGYPLWVNILSNDSGLVKPFDSASILFETYKGYPNIMGEHYSSQIEILSFDSVNSHLFVNIYADILVGFIEQYENLDPNIFELYQNYPNPFNARTIIPFNLSTTMKFEIKIFNILGIEIFTLFNGIMSTGYHELSWDGSQHSSGVYYYQIKSQNYSQTKKLILLK
jgi:hypothetical protein